MPATGMVKEICALDGCKNRLFLTDFPCKCSKKFCTKHRYDSEHACTFDYKANAKQILLKTMSTAIVAQKVDLI